MPHLIVKILTSDDGEKRIPKKWCLVESKTGNHTLCQAEYYGYGESRCEYEEKLMEKGGITCKDCLEIIKRHKAIKL